MLMVSPTPLSLICVILLCLPTLTFIFTNRTTTTVTRDGCSTVRSPSASTNGKLSLVKVLGATLQTKQQNEENSTTVSPPNPSRRLKKVAFMFLTTVPLPLAPLWEVYFNHTSTNRYNIYIHTDPTKEYNFSGVFENRVIPGSEPTRRHSPTLISAARKLLSHALHHDPGNYMFALLSPSCIPLHSFEYTNTILARSKKSFVEILSHEPGTYDRWAARGKHAMLPEVPFGKFRIGSQFFIMTRKHARLVVGDTKLWSKFKLECVEKYTCYPEENYFATLMSMRDPRGCVPATLTHVDWRGRHDGHPRTYRGSEVGPELILALRRDKPRYGDGDADADGVVNGSDSSVTERHHPFLFARKFSPDSVQALMRIASDVIFQD